MDSETSAPSAASLRNWLMLEPYQSFGVTPHRRQFRWWNVMWQASWAASRQRPGLRSIVWLNPWKRNWRPRAHV